MGLTQRLEPPIMRFMTRMLLLLTLPALLLTPSCRHAETRALTPHYSQEEAEPMSNLPHHEFSAVTPRQRHRR